MDDCPRPARRGGFCWGHRKQLQRQGFRNRERMPQEGLDEVEPAPSRVQYASPSERLTEAAIAYAEADADDDKVYDQVYDRLRKAAVMYSESLQVRRPVPVRVVAARRAVRDQRQMELWARQALT